MAPHLCPFCDFATSNTGEIYLHVQENHDDDSPLASNRVASPTTGTQRADERRDEELSLAVAFELHAADKAAERRQELEELNSMQVAATLQLEEDSMLERQGRLSTATSKDDFPYVVCPEEGCSELVHLAEFNNHIDLHSTSEHSLQAELPHPILSTKSSSLVIGHQHSLHSDPIVDTDRSIIQDMTREVGDQQRPGLHLRATSNRDQCGKARLGKAELGPYHNERRMPDSLYNRLQQGPRTERVITIGTNNSLVTTSRCETQISGLMPVLARLSGASSTVIKAYICHPSVQHVFRASWETGFCGYHNIQTLISYVQGTKGDTHESTNTKLPGILQLQDVIEDAWDRGICAHSRNEIGSIRGTRKWIGTPEALAVCRSLGIQCHITAFNDRPDKPAFVSLLDYVEAFYATSVDPAIRTASTMQAPIFLQQAGHSLSIVGLERHANGDRNLLVFDPSWRPSSEMYRFLDGKSRSVDHDKADRAMRIYRRGAEALKNYKVFEILSFLNPPDRVQPKLPIWEGGI